MNTPELKIYVDRLKDGHTEKIQEELFSDFLAITEEELSFPLPVNVKGDAYLAEDHLVLRLKATTKAKLPCCMCNEDFLFSIEIDFYHTVALDELKNPVFDYSLALRESILLQVPPFAECNGGQCPERPAVSKYLKSAPHSQFPFSDL
jgi:uncharacterized metal-binding protein YceD (DUF177 family)